MKIGMIFPGQGSQFVGMAKAFHDQERLVQEFFEEASQCLDQNFIKLCFASSEKELMETANTQTAVFLVSVAIFTLLKEKYGIVPDIVAGHSLGEYSALFAAEGINFPDGLYLLKKRALFMEETTRDQNGGMLAVTDISADALSCIVDRYDKPGSEMHVAEIVNYNGPNQLVVSGTVAELAEIKDEVRKQSGEAFTLKVSGAFHSRLMRLAEERFSVYMEKVDFHALHIPLINNVAAQIIKHPHEVKESLVKQIGAPVLWWQSMAYFSECDVIVEIGPGKTFSTLLKHEWPGKQIIAINEPKDIAELFTLLGRKMKTEETPSEPASNKDGEISSA